MATPTDNDQTLKIDPARALHREVDGELVILDVERQHYIGGNRSVTVLWPLLEAGTTRQALADRLAEEFKIDAATARADADAFADQLFEFGLVVEPGAESA